MQYEVKFLISYDHRTNYTFPSVEGRLRSVSAVVCELVTVFVPLDGADEGVGSFFGSICSQLTSFGNLDVASDRARKVIMLNNKIFLLLDIGSGAADNEEDFVKNANCCVLVKR
ncbi:hypothetical protein Tco_0854155 [Tanacetum coccineum]